MFPFLEHFPEPGGAVQRITLERFPFRIGRSEKADFIVFSRRVSKEHAQIRVQNGDEYSVHDLSSTNGTFVNGKRIQDSPLVNGDILHVAHKEFRFGCRASVSLDATTLGRTECGSEVFPLSILRGGKHLREMLNQHLVSAVFQPIVSLASGVVLGYESLGRGVHAELAESPSDLFDLAEKCQLAAELSRTFRQAGVKEATHLDSRLRLFFNLHPSELPNDSLLGSLCEAQQILGENRAIVLEVHENLVTDTASLIRLRARLNQLGIGLAYDDFGSGQARLAELAEVPPDFVKLDMKLIRDVDQSRPRQDLVLALARLCATLGVQLIAEGIESQEEATTCLQLGCQFGQGYLFGRPQPLPALSPSAGPTSRIPISALKERIRQLGR
jgi:EAL domain-containing protein (putative c-di-GMP-specific phosphodiesterase class I)